MHEGMLARALEMSKLSLTGVLALLIETMNSWLNQSKPLI